MALGRGRLSGAWLRWQPGAGDYWIVIEPTLLQVVPPPGSHDILISGYRPGSEDWLVGNFGFRLACPLDSGGHWIVAVSGGGFTFSGLFHREREAGGLDSSTCLPGSPVRVAAGYLPTGLPYSGTGPAGPVQRGNLLHKRGFRWSLPPWLRRGGHQTHHGSTWQQPANNL